MLPFLPRLKTISRQLFTANASWECNISSFKTYDLQNKTKSYFDLLIDDIFHSAVTNHALDSNGTFGQIDGPFHKLIEKNIKIKQSCLPNISDQILGSELPKI